MRVSSFVTIALVLFAASVAQISAKDLVNESVISRSLLQEAGQPKEECTGNLIEKAKCLAAQAADTVGNAASSAANTVVDTYNNVVGNDKNTTTTAPTNGTAPANGTTPASSAVATSGFAAIAVATVFALAY